MENDKNAINDNIYLSFNQSYDVSPWIVYNPYLNVYPCGIIGPENFIRVPFNPSFNAVNFKPPTKISDQKINENNSSDEPKKEYNKRRNNKKNKNIQTKSYNDQTQPSNECSSSSQLSIQNKPKMMAHCSNSSVQILKRNNEKDNKVFKENFVQESKIDLDKDFPPIIKTNTSSNNPTSSVLDFKQALQKPKKVDQEPLKDVESNENVKQKKKRKRNRKKKNNLEKFSLEESEFPELDKAVLEAAPSKVTVPIVEPKSVKSSSKKNKTSTLTLADFRIIKTATNKKRDKRAVVKKPVVMPNKKYRIANPLDSTAPIIRRGKESLNPKPKKPTKLKKIIIMYRQEKQQMAQVKDGEAVADAKPGEVSRTVTAKYGSKMHSKKFREYCNHIITEDINDILKDLLKTLIGFQDRMFHRDPKKARMKRRLCYGLREVTKYVNAKRLRLIVLAPDLEKVDSDGGLDDVVANIIEKSRDAGIPCVFGLSRGKLAYLSYKKSKVAAVGVFNYEGAEEYVKKLLPAIDDAKHQYNKLKEIMECMEEVNIVEDTKLSSPIVPKENPQNPPHSQQHTITQKLELTHSRTPSQALSEPISDIVDLYSCCCSSSSVLAVPQESCHLSIKTESGVISEGATDEVVDEEGDNYEEKEEDELVDEFVENILTSVSRLCIHDNNRK